MSDKKDSKSIQLGKRGEQAACRYLTQQGYEILERNWKSPAGEADIIATDYQNLVFIEVKTRSGVEKGLPEEAVTLQKRKRYEGIACYYMKESPVMDVRVRFDVIGITVNGDRAIMRHHIDAYRFDQCRF